MHRYEHEPGRRIGQDPDYNFENFFDIGDNAT